MYASRRRIDWFWPLMVATAAGSVALNVFC